MVRFGSFIFEFVLRSLFSNYRKLETNDEMLTEININNMKRISKERIKALIKASCASKHVRKLSLANTAISDQEARVSIPFSSVVHSFYHAIFAGIPTNESEIVGSIEVQRLSGFD